MLFEPIQDLVRTQGDKLNDKLSGVEGKLAKIDENTEAQIARNQWVNKSQPANAESFIQFRNDSAYGWLIRSVAGTVAIECFLSSESDRDFLGSVESRNHRNVRWYIPVGAILFVKNLEEKTNGFVTLQVEILRTEAFDAHTGKSEEHIDSPMYPTLPSGHPLDEPQIDVRT